jgi:hypothetical protein
MKKLIVSVTMPLLIVAGISHASPPPQFQLTLTTPHALFKTGEAIPVQLTITNTSDKEVMYQLGGVRGLHLDISVLYGSGISPPKTSDYAGRTKGWPGDGDVGFFINDIHTVRISPGSTYQETVNLNEMYDMSKPGIYLVRDAQDGAISNLIRVTVTN